MQVFTKIYLIGTSNETVDNNEETDDVYRRSPWRVEFKQILRESITLDKDPPCYKTGDRDRECS
jgi:hypothetical protein